MKITNTTRALVNQALKAKGMKQSDLANKIGVDRSWVTRFFKSSGGMQKLKDEYRWAIQEALDIEFFKAVETKRVSSLAMRIDKIMEKEPRVAEAISLLLDSFDAFQRKEVSLFPGIDRKITLIQPADIMAAAGAGIAADVIDWEGDRDIVRVKIVGESMTPLFSDGDIIEMKHKRASRSPYMKKGLIYLVQLEGEWMVKRYGTRKARPDEKGVEYLTGSGRVGILRSENPNFDDIDITGPFEWAAWYNKE